MMRLMPIVYVSDMGKAMDFYSALGLTTDVTDRAAMWAEMQLGDGILALHRSDPQLRHEVRASRLELAFVATQPLELLVERLIATGIALERNITDEGFGRSIMVKDPDGLMIQINEHDRELYT